MSGFRLAAIDLDGTLLRSDSTLSDRSRAALAEARAAGIDVVLVTARSPRSVLPIARDAGLDGLAICANGATLYDLDTETIVRHSALQAEVAHRIVRGLRERVPDIAFGWELELRFGSEPGYEAQRDAARWPRPDDAYPACDVLEWSEPMTKLLARLPGADLEALLDRGPRALRGRGDRHAHRRRVRRGDGGGGREGARARGARGRASGSPASTSSRSATS